MSYMQKVDIIGAGIGGLTTAIALQQKGFKIRIFEQAEEIQHLGAGIILANNAMQVYQHLGLEKDIANLGERVFAINITEPNLNIITSSDLSFFENKFSTKSIAIHRASLQKLLLSKIEPSNIYLSKKLSNISLGTPNKLFFQDGSEYQSNCVIAADGINSNVRIKAFGNHAIRYANQMCWRGISQCSLSSQFNNQLWEFWGRNERFGFVAINPKEVYWYALKNTDDPKSNRWENSFTQQRGYHPVISDLIEKTPVSSIFESTIKDIKPFKTWSKGTVCLLGDAAHPTTPNMGQGACQAIEDAYILADCMARMTPERAFKEYQSLRVKKAHYIVNTSWRLGKVAHWTHPTLQYLRNKSLSLIPKAINTIQMTKLYRLN